MPARTDLIKYSLVKERLPRAGGVPAGGPAQPWGWYIYYIHNE
jgi:hypothetical protein